MEYVPSDKTWPDMSNDLRYREVRLPGDFRRLVASRDYTNEEVGRIVRCLLMNTDFFITNKIEADVFHFREILKAKESNRQRVAKFREKKNGHIGKYCGDNEVSTDLVECGNVAAGENVTVTTNSEIVSEPEVKPNSDSISCTKKTPPIIEEKTPPIVPLKKNPSSLLEKIRCTGNGVRRPKLNKNVTPKDVQLSLFSMVAGDGQPDMQAESTGKGQEGTSESSARSGRATRPQDIESAPRAVLVQPDSRVDGAWITPHFANFWEHYPKKLAKADALKAFTKIIKKQNDIDRFMKIVIASVEWWKTNGSWTKDNGKFIPYPATWLNRGSWEDSLNNNVESIPGQSQFTKNDMETVSDEELIKRMIGGG